MSYIALSLEAAQQQGSLSEGLLNNQKCTQCVSKKERKKCDAKSKQGPTGMPFEIYWCD